VHEPPASAQDISAYDVVLFDLDGVLLHGDTMASLVKMRLARNPWRFPAAALRMLGGMAGGLFAATARERANRAIVRVALRGLTPGDYAAACEDVAKALAASARNDASIQTARECAQRGQRVIVTTASEFEVAQAYLRHVGIDGAELLASYLHDTPRGPVFGSHNVGTQKVVSARAAGVDLRRTILFTDSASDLPLMECVAHTVLVRPSRRTERAVRRRRLSASLQ